MTRQLKILFLGSSSSILLQWLVDQDEYVVGTETPITPFFVDQGNYDFLVSFGYRYILRRNILDKFPSRAVNLHISYLPWNRGADPNLWSFIQDTPKGVTIHYLNEGIDTGDIIVQRQVTFEHEGETLATTYQKLQLEIQQLFQEYWSQISAGTCPRTKQLEGGTFHLIRDREAVEHLLTEGWNTPVEGLQGGQ